MHAEHVIENAFGILAAIWRIFHWPIQATAEHIEQYMLAALALYNYLRLTNNAALECIQVVLLILKVEMEVYI